MWWAYNVDATTEDGTPWWANPSHLERLDDSHCFLCGSPVSGETKTREHVFPDWLLNRYNLHNRTITLLNGTHIPYRNLTIPCCDTCNKELLSRIENQVARATLDPKDFLQLDEKLVFQWLSKILLRVVPGPSSIMVALTLRS